MADDDFWNESQVKTSAKIFSFDDREGGNESSNLQMCGISLDGTVQLFQQVQGLRQSESDSSTSSDSKSSVQLELLQLISEKALNCLIDADSPQFTIKKSDLSPAEELRMLQRKYDELFHSPDAHGTALKMMLKQPYLLETFRSLQDKKQLLEEVVSLGDGDSILAVVVFLAKTLKKSYFNQLLLENPVAAAHYVSHLSTRMRTAELTDLLEMLGKNKEASMRQFEAAQGRMPRLVACATNHSFDGKDAHILDSYIKFLEWQSESKVSEPSVVDCLSVLCEKHWGQQGPRSPLTLCQAQGVSDKQYQWLAITARAKLHAWQDIQDLLTAKSWLRGPKLRVCLPLDAVILSVHAHGASQELLYSLLALVENTDKRLSIARQVACDKTIIEASMSLRDKQSLRTSLPLN